jgi:transcriptional regulator with PAS, ATPase and Fis domain
MSPSAESSLPTALPQDAQSILELVAHSFFSVMAGASEGMLLVDKQARVVWINDQYRRFLPALGFEKESDFVGHPVSRVVQNTQMHRVLETGKPILMDLLTNRAGTFLVSRFPLKDESGAVIGALGIVLFDHAETHLQPLMAKFDLLQRDLDEARKELAASRRQPKVGLRQAKYSLASFVGTSPAASEVKRQARRAAQSASTVLLQGETGTGKELLAHGIHAASNRADCPFVSVNIAAVPDTLMEAEFFGVAPGAYTGADRRGRDGKFKLADRGTLFLDEIGDMPLAVQAKLLRALQEREIEPLGSNQLIGVNVRVIAATSRDLGALVREGKFREDLFYRLNVLPIRVPPLRERAADMPALVEALTEDLAHQSGLPIPDISEDALQLLARLRWRGNIRELRNLLEQAILAAEGKSVDAALIQGLMDADALEPALEASAAKAALLSPASLASPPTATQAATDNAPPEQLLQPLAEQISALERRAIAAALQATGGNKQAVARMLGISRATLYQRLGEMESLG